MDCTSHSCVKQEDVYLWDPVVVDGRVGCRPEVQETDLQPQSFVAGLPYVTHFFHLHAKKNHKQCRLELNGADRTFLYVGSRYR